MICKNCGAELSNDDAICTCCSADSEKNDKTDGETLQESCFNDLADDISIKKKRKIALMIIATVLAPLLCAVAFGVYNLISSITLYRTEKYTKTEIAEICDELDYSAIAATLEHYCNSIESTYLYDADSDGRKELFTVTYNDLYIQKPTVLAFDTIDVGTMASATQYGAAGDAKIIAYDNNLALEWGCYSVGNMSFQCDKWTDSGWVKIVGTEDLYDMDNLDEHQEKELNEITQRIKDDSECDIGKISYNHILSKYYNASNSKDMIQEYRVHLNRWWGDGYKYIEEDIDGDGKGEYAFIINNFAKRWTENLTLSGTDGFLMEEYLDSMDEIGSICIYVDTDKTGIVFHTFFTEKIIGDNVDVLWQDGELILNVTNEIKDFAITFFCSEIELVSENYESENHNFKMVGERYLQFLRKYKYNEVLAKYVDICDAPGKEMICVCSIDGDNTVNVYALYCGRIVKVYEQNPDNSDAIYISEENKKPYLLYYSQSVMKSRTYTGRAKISTYYSYWLCRFDVNYVALKGANNSLFLDSDSTPTESDNAFFAELNSYINSAVVCVDPYELTGYSYISGSETDSSQTDEYLYITNCSQNKKGTVHVEMDSWLNFRKGPSTDYDRILSDSSDPESFVKQMNGSSVTIIDTVNTGDRDNPIWVKIQIKYAGETLIGYSSQRYIDISSIKTIKVGETFEIKAKTNAGELNWTGNDKNVLSVNAKTGKIKGLEPGLSLVKVESESGLSDSCLILVTKN